MTIRSSDIPKVLVCQRGARHRYAIPRLLEESGRLAALYTDSSAYSHAGKLATRLNAMGIRTLNALASRKISEIPRDKIHSIDNLILPSRSKRLSRSYTKSGLQNAAIVYSMCGEEYEFLQWAKEQGAKIIADIFIHPGSARIVEDETLRCTGKRGVEASYIEVVEGHFRRVFALADILLCPSQWVADGVRDMDAENGHKIRIVPYGSSLQLVDQINSSPKRGSILFAGREPLRKGVHILAEAAHLVRMKHKSADFRLAGINEPDIEWVKHGKELNCLGNVPMDEMRQEYSQADIFVLPSFSEGQAGVLLEAMSCGVPVIATRESGVDLCPDAGIIVPAGDAHALAEALVDLLDNREKRDHFAEGALRQASDFSLHNWRMNLVKILEELSE